MTKKDYEAIARQFRSTHAEYDGLEAQYALDSLAGRICTVLQHDNPRFDCERFIAACNV